MTAVPPTGDEVRTRLKLPATVVDDVELEETVDAEIAAQARLCTVDPYYPELRQAVYRRVSRALAAKGLPLGMMDSEFGQTPLRPDDVEINRLEGPYLRFNIGTRGGA